MWCENEIDCMMCWEVGGFVIFGCLRLTYPRYPEDAMVHREDLVAVRHWWVVEREDVKVVTLNRRLVDERNKKCGG